MRGCGARGLLVVQGADGAGGGRGRGRRGAGGGEGQGGRPDGEGGAQRRNAMAALGEPEGLNRGARLHGEGEPVGEERPDHDGGRGAGAGPGPGRRGARGGGEGEGRLGAGGRLLRGAGVGLRSSGAETDEEREELVDGAGLDLLVDERPDVVGQAPEGADEAAGLALVPHEGGEEGGEDEVPRRRRRG